MARLSGRLKLALWGLLALNALLIFWVVVVAPRMEARAVADIGRGDYELVSTDGSVFTEAALVGAPSAVFFGFTHCPDVCPTTLGDISAWQEDLGGAEALKVYFVTVDPARDTADILGDYVGWVPGVAGVTGSEEEMGKALASFKVFVQKVPTEDDDYTMDHSASVLLFDKDGRFVETIRYQEDHDVAVGQLRNLLGLGAGS